MSFDNSDFGTGPALDDNHDIPIDNSGSVQTSSDTAQLADDLDYRVTPYLDNILGTRSSSVSETDIRATIVTVLETDARVQSARVDSITYDVNSISIDAIVQTVAGYVPLELTESVDQ